MTRHVTDRRLSNMAQRLDQAAGIKPNLDAHLATRLAHVDSRQANETGISGNTISDPVISHIMARSDIITKSGLVERRIVEIEAALNALDEAMRAAWGRELPQLAEEAPVCYMSGCSREVSSYRRTDGTVAFRLGGDHGGLCETHRMQARRERGAA